MKKCFIQVTVFFGLITGNLMAAQAANQPQKKTISERFRDERDLWRRGLAAAQKLYITRKPLNRQERRDLNAVRNRVGLTALLAAIGIGTGVKVRQMQAQARRQAEALAEQQRQYAEQQRQAALEVQRGQEQLYEELSLVWHSSPAEKASHLLARVNETDFDWHIGKILKDIHSGHKLEEWYGPPGVPKNLLHILLVSLGGQERRQWRGVEKINKVITEFLSKVSDPNEMVNARIQGSVITPIEIVRNKCEEGELLANEAEMILKTLLKHGAEVTDKQKEAFKLYGIDIDRLK